MIEIRELIIKVAVDPEPPQENAQGNGQATPGFDKKEVISECLEQVAQMLKNKKER